MKQEGQLRTEWLNAQKPRLRNMMTEFGFDFDKPPEAFDQNVDWPAYTEWRNAGVLRALAAARQATVNLHDGESWMATVTRASIMAGISDTDLALAMLAIKTNRRWQTPALVRKMHIDELNAITALDDEAVRRARLAQR